MNTAKTKIILPGGTGYLGAVLAESFAKCGHDVVVLTRGEERDAGRVRFVHWDGETVGPWTVELEGALAVINLAGRSVDCRYNERNRRVIYDSRLKSTRAVGEAIARCQNPPRVWLNSSSATIYRHAEDRPMDEATGEIGTGFSVDVCQKWEQTLEQARTPRTRKVALRTAMVFGRGDCKVFKAFRRITRLGLGGTLGPGTQYVSWVHSEDFARAARWIIEHDELAGPVNLSSPNPVPNAQFMRRLREAFRVPIGLPASRWMLEVGALFLRTETELLLKSRRVVPGRLLDAGLQFRFPEFRTALADIVGGGHACG